MFSAIYIIIHNVTYRGATWRLRRLISLVYACFVPWRVVTHDFGSCGAATIYNREFIGKLPIIASIRRGFSYRANRSSISHDLGPHAGCDQGVFQVQRCPQKADQFACDRGVGDTSRFGLTQFVKTFVQSALRFPSNGDDLRRHRLLSFF